MADNSIKIKTEIQTKQAEVQLATLENRMSKTAAKAEQLKQAMAKMEGTRIESKEYQEINKQIAKASTELDKLIDKQLKMTEAGKQGTPAFEQMDARIEELHNELAYAKGELKELISSGKAFTLGEDTEQYQRLASQLRGVEAEMDIQNQKQSIMVQKMNQSATSASRLASVLDHLKSGLSKVGTFMGKAFNSIAGHFKRSQNQFKSSLKSLLKYAIGIRALMALFRAIKRAASEAFNDMAKQIPEVNASLSSMKTAMNGLKASVGTMLQPLLVAVSGLLTTIINKVAELASAIGGLFARLTGQNYVYKATAAQVDYAKSLDGTGKAAKKAQKQLAGFDELNVLNSEDDSSSGGAAPMATYTKEAIPDNIANIADALKAMWEKADFTDLGKAIATKIRDSLESIDWDSIQETGRKLGKSFATFLNGFSETEGFGESVGKAWAEASNTIWYTVESFFENFKALEFGAMIGKTIASWFENLDWGAIGHTIGLAMTTLMELLIGFLENINPSKIGDAIHDLISGVDWQTLVYDLFLLLGELVVAAFELLYGILKGLCLSLADLFKWLWENIKEMTSIAWNAIKKFLSDISSKIVDGIKSAFQKLGDFWRGFWNGLKDVVVGVFQGIWNFIKGIINSIIGGIESMVNGVISGLNWMINGLNKISFDVPDWVPFMGGKKFGFDISNISEISIPKLAEGAVIPPNKEFMAVLGDQKNGTNIEAPLDTIKEALRDTLSQFGGVDNGDIVVKIDGYEVFRAVRKQNKLFKQTTGIGAF